MRKTRCGRRHGGDVESQTFEAVTEDGDKYDGVLKVTVKNTYTDSEGKKTEDVKFTTDGMIIYNDDVVKASTSGAQNAIEVTIEADGWHYTHKTSVYTFYGSNKTINEGEQLPSNTVNTTTYAYYEVDGEEKKLEFKYGNDGEYGVYIKDTDTKVCDMTMTVTALDGDNAGETVQLTDGKFTAAGKYHVDIEYTFAGTTTNAYFDVTVKAAQA